MFENFKPIGDKVLVKPDIKAETTKSGIYLPDIYNMEKVTRGTVLAVGPGRRLDDGARSPLEVAVGNTVIYTKYAGTELELGSEKYLLIREEELLAVV